MNWTAILSVVLLSTFKFMLAPFTAINGYGVNFLTSIIASTAGAWLSATFFYFLSEYFQKKSREKQLKKEQDPNYVKKFSRRKWKVNRAILKVKLGIGQLGICLLAPLFLSVPVGTIICAKFYGKKKTTYPMILSGLFLNAVLLSSLAHIFRG